MDIKHDTRLGLEVDRRSFDTNILRFGMAEAESRALLDPRESKSVATEGGRNGT